MISRVWFAIAAILFLSLPSIAPAQTVPASQPAGSAEAIPFTQEVLPNGLRVIYAPLHQAPVVHVRVLYHVGSRDERPDRQGFAHMFEHMMFRGSAHVAPQEHMHLIDGVGGICNAFTSFDQTVYHDTIPAEHLRMALYLEADRMSSFKVNDEIYKTERKVVAEEWRIKQNRPYGNLYEDLLKTAFTTHSYRWTPIGNMEQLLSAPVAELQDFFNTYYVPNNAVLVIAGDIDVDAARQMVHDYFAWIPAGKEVVRNATPEPAQLAVRSAVVPDMVPLNVVVLGWHIPPFRSDDHYALSVLSAVLGEGSSSRLHKLLVSSQHPLCTEASTIYEQLEDGGIFGVLGMVMTGKSPADVQKDLQDAVAEFLAHPISDEELAKAKTLRRIEMIHARQTAERVAEQLGEEALIGGDPNRVNRDLARLDAVTAADVQVVAKAYLQPQSVTLLRVVPDPLGTATRKASTQAAAAIASKDAPVAASTEPVKARDIQFPENYPAKPPINAPASAAKFNKGVESEINGVKVIVLSDHRLPIVNWSLTMMRGSHSDPAGKEGLASTTAAMLRRGAGGHSYQQINEELESHGIELNASEGGDYSRLSGSCPTEELDRALARTRDLLRNPEFPVEEFAKLQAQSIDGLTASLDSPGTAADREVLLSLFGGSPLGHPSTPVSLSNISLDDVRQFYAANYRPDGAILTISGDVSLERADTLAHTLLDSWQPQALPAVGYTLPPVSDHRTIILIDRPSGRGATVRMAIRSYDIHDDHKFAGSLASTILSSGIESRLMRYVRAERGLVYGVFGYFQPGRHAGSFVVTTDTKIENVADTVQAVYKVLDDLHATPVTDDELAEAKRRVVGSMVMRMQTIQQQADMRVDALLNGYPIDYYDVYPQKVTAVTAGQIQDVMNKFVVDDAMTIIIVAPAAGLKEKLQALGDVKVVPMPAHRPGVLPKGAPSTQPSHEMLKPA